MSVKPAFPINPKALAALRRAGESFFGAMPHALGLEAGVKGDRTGNKRPEKPANGTGR